MHKTIKFKLKDFNQTPNKLRVVSNQNSPKEEFQVNIQQLFKQYYIDRWSFSPPSLNLINFEYFGHLSNSIDFRFKKHLLNLNSAHKRNISFNLGQAFFRYFLYEFCDITYFAHMDKVLDKETHPALDGMQIIRISKGDVPDYLCAKSVNKPFIGEAKGRFSSISFNTLQFDKWREQFKRIKILDKHKIPKKLKGYIIATKLVTENNRNSNKSIIYAEDPYTIGEKHISDKDLGIGKLCIALHYSDIFKKIGFPLLGFSLEYGFPLHEKDFDNLILWKSNHEKIKDKLFVGHILPISNDIEFKIGAKRFEFHHKFQKLFIGIDFETFNTLKKVSSGEWKELSNINPIKNHFNESDLTLLRDGIIIGDSEFFKQE